MIEARVRVPLIALLLLAVSMAAQATEVSVGRLKVLLQGERWQTLKGPPFQLDIPNGRSVAGTSAIVVLNDAGSNPLAVLFIGSTVSEANVTAQGTCKGSSRTYVRGYATDGFISFACALVGGPFFNNLALRNGMKRLGPALESMSIASPPHGYLLQVVVTSGNGGAIVLEGLLSAQVVGIKGGTVVADVPANVPMRYAALADAIGDAVLAAARSISGTLVMPHFESPVVEQQNTTK